MEINRNVARSLECMVFLFAFLKLLRNYGVFFVHMLSHIPQGFYLHLHMHSRNNNKLKVHHYANTYLFSISSWQYSLTPQGCFGQKRPYYDGMGVWIRWTHILLFGPFLSICHFTQICVCPFCSLWQQKFALLLRPWKDHLLVSYEIHKLIPG